MKRYNGVLDTFQLYSYVSCTDTAKIGVRFTLTDSANWGNIFE